MSKLNARVLLLLLACLVGGVVFTMGFQATKSPSLRVGTTIRDPQEYLTQRLRHQAHIPLRVSTLASQPSGGVYTYATTYAFLGHNITLRNVHLPLRYQRDGSEDLHPPVLAHISLSTMTAPNEQR